MQLIQLQYFCTVARCRNMSRAARELCISQPALSKAISNLEEELEVQLFDRIGRGIQLNQEGRLFYHQISHIMMLLDSAVMDVRKVRRAKKSDISVLFSAATFIASRVRTEFLRLHPEVNIEIKCSYFPSQSDLTDCDIYIYASPFVAGKNMNAVKLMEEPLVLACGRDHELAHRAEVNLIETAQYMYACLPPYENLHENFIRLCREAGFEPKIPFCTEDSYAFFGSLSSGSMLTLVPGYTGFMELTDDLALIKIREPKCTRTIYMATHQQREITEQCAEFQSFCFSFFNDLSQNNVLTRKDGSIAAAAPAADGIQRTEVKKMNKNKCKLFLLSGFLGSGKTTLLKHLVSTCPEGEKIAVLINEFGKAGVDGSLVRKNGLDIMEVNRGSIFCSCAKGDFLRGLYTLLTDYAPTVLLIEASGVADTTDIKNDLSGGLLSEYYQLCGNICLVDAKRFEAWLDMFNSVLMQVKAATHIIINKSDLVSKEELDALVKHVNELNPNASLVTTSFCQADWGFVYGSLATTPQATEIPDMAQWESFIKHTLDEMTPHMAPPDKFASLSVFWEGDPVKFKEALTKLPDDLVRAKGYFVDENGKWKVFNIVGSEAPVLSEAVDGFNAYRNLAIFIRKKHARKEIPTLLQDYGLKLLELRF